MLSQPYGWPVWEMSSIVFFILPGAVILVLYCRMGFRIRARSRNHLGKGVKGSVHGETRQAQSRKAIIRMLAAVVVAFFVCWAPFHAQRLIYLYGQNWSHYKEINEWVFSVAGWLYYVSSTVNPILYNVMSNRYRVAFRETLCCGRKHSHNGIGFSRDQSSFRETTIAASGEGSHLVRVRSVSSEPLHRTNTARLSRHSTLSATLSKDYINHNAVQKPNWTNTNQTSKKWSKNDAILRGKKAPKLKGLFSNFASQDGGHAREPPCSKRKEITFETETNNLINSNNKRDSFEMDNIKKYNSALNVEGSKVRITDSLVAVSNRRSVSDGGNAFEGPNDDSKSQQGDQTYQKRDSVQDVVVVLSKTPSNGIKKFYPSCSHKSINFAFPNSIVRAQDESFVGEVMEENNKISDIMETVETCI